MGWNESPLTRLLFDSNLVSMSGLFYVGYIIQSSGRRPANSSAGNTAAAAAPPAKKSAGSIVVAPLPLSPPLPRPGEQQALLEPALPYESLFLSLLGQLSKCWKRTRLSCLWRGGRVRRRFRPPVPCPPWCDCSKRSGLVVLLSTRGMHATRTFRPNHRCKISLTRCMYAPVVMLLLYWYVMIRINSCGSSAIYV